VSVVVLRQNPDLVLYGYTDKGEPLVMRRKALPETLDQELRWGELGPDVYQLCMAYVDMRMDTEEFLALLDAPEGVRWRGPFYADPALMQTVWE
jgi:hypothetical protein